MFALKIHLLEAALRRELGDPMIDLSWLHMDVPSSLDDAQVRLFDAKVEFLRRRRLATLEAFAHAQAEALAGGFAS